MLATNATSLLYPVAGIIPTCFAHRYVRPCQVLVPWYKLPGLSIWCLAHNCYDCSCGYVDLPPPSGGSSACSYSTPAHAKWGHVENDDSLALVNHSSTPVNHSTTPINHSTVSTCNSTPLTLSSTIYTRNSSASPGQRSVQLIAPLSLQSSCNVINQQLSNCPVKTLPHKLVTFPNQPSQPHPPNASLIDTFPIQSPRTRHKAHHLHLSSPNQPTTPHLQPISSPNELTTPHHQPIPPHHQPTPPHHQPTPPHHQPTSPHHQPTSPHHQPTPPHHQPTSPHHQPTSPHQQPTPPPLRSLSPHSPPLHDSLRQHHSDSLEAPPKANSNCDPERNNPSLEESSSTEGGTPTPVPCALAPDVPPFIDANRHLHVAKLAIVSNAYDALSSDEPLDSVSTNK